ncbi:MAG: hypothetical protein SVJ22_00885 [Halobacteriota archaeon]|nr:hypothetical protein [Halobacteriota archaeon]
MSQDLKSALDELYETEGIEACILYRIDGTPIALRTPDRRRLMDIMLWMENEIKFVMGHIERDRLEDVIFTFKDHKIAFRPSSKSTVLATILNPDAHLQLTSLEITRASTKIKEAII